MCAGFRVVLGLGLFWVWGIGLFVIVGCKMGLFMVVKSLGKGCLGFCVAADVPPVSCQDSLLLGFWCCQYYYCGIIPLM